MNAVKPITRLVLRFGCSSARLRFEPQTVRVEVELFYLMGTELAACWTQLFVFQLSDLVNMFQNQDLRMSLLDYQNIIDKQNNQRVSATGDIGAQEKLAERNKQVSELLSKITVSFARTIFDAIFPFFYPHKNK